MSPTKLSLTTPVAECAPVIGKPPSYLYNDDNCVGYDYNGIPQYDEDSVDNTAIFQAQSLEREMQSPTKCLGLRGHLI